MSRRQQVCGSCGHFAVGLDAARLGQLRDEHECHPADLLDRATAHYRKLPGATNAAIATWLKDCAQQARAMTHPQDWDPCDEPGSVKDAVAVARTLWPAEVSS